MYSAIITAFFFIQRNTKYVRLLLILACCLGLVGFVFRYMAIKEKLKTTEFQLAQAQVQLENVKKDVQQISQTHVEILKAADESRKRADDLERQLERRGKKSISQLANKKAKLVEEAINSGSKRSLKCLESVSAGGDC